MAKKRKVQETEKIALHEEDFYETSEVKKETIRLVVFRLAEEWYGVEIRKIKGVVDVDKITYLPLSPDYIAGIVNLRGNILSVIDLKKIFGLPQEELTEKSRLVVIESGTLETGLLVDEVAQVLEVSFEKIDPALATIAQEQAEYIEGECKIDDKLIGILDVEKILKRRGAQ